MNIREDFEKAYKDWIHDKSYSLAYWTTDDIAAYWGAWALRYAAQLSESCFFRVEDAIRPTITDDSLRLFADQLQITPQYIAETMPPKP